MDKVTQSMRQRAKRDEKRGEINRKAVRQQEATKLRSSFKSSVSKSRNRIYHKEIYRNLRERAIEEYGGKCVCCGEDSLCFLTIDHVNNDGGKHRRESERGDGNYQGSGVSIYRYLRRHKYPKDGRFQVLCYNCNCCKQHDPIGHRKAHPNARNIDGLGEIPGEFSSERQLLIPTLEECMKCSSKTESKSSSGFQRALFEQTR